MIVNFIVLYASFGIWLSKCTCVHSAPTSDGFESMIITSGGILSLVTIPIILFTVACCATKKKANTKVAFTKQEGTFKVTIIEPPNDPVEHTVKDVLKQSHSDKTEVTMNALTPGTNCDELEIRQLLESPVMPKCNQTHDNTPSINSDVIISPNPSYTAAESDEDKFTLSESLYIYCEQPSTDEEDKALHGVNEHSNTSGNRPVRRTSHNDRAAHGQTFEDSIQLTVTAAREECDNALYAGGNVPMNPVTSYGYIPGEVRVHKTQQTMSDGRQECSNALYEAREYNAALRTDVKMNCNPSYSIMHTAPNKLTYQNSYDYIPPQTYEDHIDSLYEVRDCDNAHAMYDHLPALTRSTSYDYIPPQTQEDHNDSLYKVRDCDNARAMYHLPALTRSTSYDYIPPQIHEDSLQEMANGGSRKECDNALYEARKYENVDHDIPSSPDHKTVLTRSTSYDYIPPQTHEDSLQEMANGGSRKECDNALYEARKYENVDHDIPSNPDHKTVLTRSTSQNSYDHVYEAYDDDGTHDYSLIDSVEVSGTLCQHQLTAKNSTDAVYVNSNNVVSHGAYQNPAYAHKVTMLASCN